MTAIAEQARLSRVMLDVFAHFSQVPGRKGANGVYHIALEVCDSLLFAAKLLTILNATPTARILVLCGYNHVNQIKEILNYPNLRRALAFKMSDYLRNKAFPKDAFLL